MILSCRGRSAGCTRRAAAVAPGRMAADGLGCWRALLGAGWYHCTCGSYSAVWQPRHVRRGNRLDPTAMACDCLGICTQVGPITKGFLLIKLFTCLQTVLREACPVYNHL